MTNAQSNQPTIGSVGVGLAGISSRAYRPAVFSVIPKSQAARPSQVTPFPGLFLAGDWTRTGWPATMENAVRSGNVATTHVWRQIV